MIQSTTGSQKVFMKCRQSYYIEAVTADCVVYTQPESLSAVWLNWQCRKGRQGNFWASSWSAQSDSTLSLVEIDFVIISGWLAGFTVLNWEQRPVDIKWKKGPSSCRHTMLSHNFILIDRHAWKSEWFMGFVSSHLCQRKNYSHAL